MTINNLGLQGHPTKPFVDAQAYAGTDVFVDMTFLDRTRTPSVPTSVTYELDDLTNVVNMIPSTTITTGLASTYTLQLPAASMQMSNAWAGSQLCQLWVTAVLADGSTVNDVAVVELVAIQVPGTM